MTAEKANLPSSSTAVGGQVSNSEYCDSGYISVSGYVADDTYPFETAGDYAYATFNNCYFTDFGTYNGELYFRLDSYSDSLIELSMELTDFSFEDDLYHFRLQSGNLFTQTALSHFDAYGDPGIINSTATGDLSVTEDGLTHILAHNDFLTVYEDGVTLNEAFYARYSAYGLTSYTLNGQGIGAIDINTLVPFEEGYDYNYPIRGQAEIYGALGQMLMTANPDGTITLDIDSDDDGFYETTKTVNWEDL